MGVTFVLARATRYRFTGLLNVSTAEVFLFAFLDELAEHERNRLWRFALFEEDPDDVVPIWLIQEVGILPAGRYPFGTFAGTLGPSFWTRERPGGTSILLSLQR